MIWNCTKSSDHKQSNTTFGKCEFDNLVIWNHSSQQVTNDKTELFLFQFSPYIYICCGDGFCVCIFLFLLFSEVKNECDAAISSNKLPEMRKSWPILSACVYWSWRWDIQCMSVLSRQNNDIVMSILFVVDWIVTREK